MPQSGRSRCAFGFCKTGPDTDLTDLPYEAGFTRERGFMARVAKSVIAFFAAPLLQDGQRPAVDFNYCGFRLSRSLSRFNAACCRSSP
jgi:hypothetical protein